MTVLKVICPLTVILGAVRVVESTMAVSQTKAPVSNVAIAEKLVIGAFKPNMGTESALEVVFPVSCVLLVGG
jgi:hypothetical protein